MVLLCIDTTKPNAEIALFNNGDERFLTISEQKKHSETLLVELEQFLCESSITIQNVNFLGSVTGPGSFTGIRIGMATVKAFSFALNLQIVADNYFQIIAKTVKNGFVALKNTSTTVYLGEIVNEAIKEVCVEETVNVLNKINNKPLFVSEHEQINELNSYKNINVIKNYNKIMLNHFVAKVNNNAFTKNAEFAPFYAQLSQAEKNLEG